jgi:HD-GYP domain-containing protein (c-di-GMP phosphodiesterase class II)
VFVCDAFDAMTAPRPYARLKSTDDALEELRECTGSQFDPQVVEAFCAVVEETRAPAETLAAA